MVAGARLPFFLHLNHVKHLWGPAHRNSTLVIASSVVSPCGAVQQQVSGGVLGG